YVVAGSLANPDPAFALAVFALNPLILVEQVGSGHNDGLIVLFGLLVVWALQRGRDRAAIGFAVIATLVKMPGVLWLEAVLVLLVFGASVYPWYASWVVPLAALTDAGALRRSILVASATLVALYAVPYAWAEQASRHELWSALRLSVAFLFPLLWWAGAEIRA